MLHQTYILISILIASLLLFTFILSKTLYLKKENAFLILEKQELIDKNNTLQIEKIEDVKKIQELLTEIKINKWQEEKIKNYHKQFEGIAQETLIKMSNNLTKNLLNCYQHENKNIQEYSEKQIKNTTLSLKNDLEQLIQQTKIIEKELEKSNDKVSNLQNSLLSSSSVGEFTELTLNNILTSSGLQNNIDFQIQPTFYYEGKIHRPDAVIFLPDNNFIIIDAKSSKFFLESKLTEEKDDNQKTLKFKKDDLNERLVKSMSLHLKNLSSKEYNQSLSNTLEKKNGVKPNSITTLMFLHSESAVDQISKLDNSFMSKSWKVNIFPVGPTGLINMLSIAKRNIGQKKQISNYYSILQEMQKMLFSLNILTEHGMRLGNSIQSLTMNYDKFAASFNQNFLSKAKKISELGIQNKKEKQNFLTRYELKTSDTNIIDFTKIDNKKKVNE